MENESKTPASALTGVELCERVALGMGWILTLRGPKAGAVFAYGEPGPNRIFRSVPNTLHSDRSQEFRPDLDGNHLAEVKAECDRRGWSYQSGKNKPSGFFAQVHSEFIAGNPSEAIAFLRAFVAAVEAEKATDS